MAETGTTIIETDELTTTLLTRLAEVAELLTAVSTRVCTINAADWGDAATLDHIAHHLREAAGLS